MTPHGILNVDKPAGITSFRVVELVRRGAGVKKVGHAGTLDPLATGVLIVCLGQAARVTEYLMDLPKTYRATVRLGTATDTFDAEGRTVFEGDPAGVSEAALREALAELAARGEQVPPSFSALKVGGTPAYRLAREGRSVGLRSRPVRIDEIRLLAYRKPDVEMEVVCGRGTYIRSLADDLGRALGCGAHLAALRRTAVGPFDVEEAVTLEALERALAEGSWRDLLLPIDYGLGDYPQAHLEIEEEKDVRHGIALDASSPAFGGLEGAADGAICRAYAEDGSLIGMLKYENSSKTWKPAKVFISELPASK